MSGNNAQETPRMVSRRGMSNFRVMHEDQIALPPGLSASFLTIVPTESVVMLKPRSAEASTRIFSTCIVESNGDHDHVQRSAFFLSGIATVFPGLTQVTRDVIKGKGYRVEELTEENAADNQIELQEPTDVGYLLVALGQMVFILFKNIDERSYTNFMRARIAALKSEAGVLDELVPGEGDILFSFEAAKSVSVTVGNHPRLRAYLLKIILANRNGDTPHHKVCSYIAEILNWTEMSSLVFIVGTLLASNSPVLYDSRVAIEVNNLYEAYKAICSKEHPQYYRILHPTEAATTLIKSRFSTLAEVARKYQMSINNTVQNFAQGGRENSPLVTDLLTLHSNHMRGMVRSNVQRQTRFLTNLNAQDDELSDDEE